MKITDVLATIDVNAARHRREVAMQRAHDAGCSAPQGEVLARATVEGFARFATWTDRDLELLDDALAKLLAS